MAIDYKSAGVDIEKGDALVDWLKGDKQDQPHSDKILEGIGGFASIFQMNFPDIKDPCLVSATDGVGTKLKLAIDLESYSGLGQDLVAMCANDLVCTGAQPLFFLDYFATSKLDFTQTKPFLEGLRQACKDVGAALIGGETAEMPGMYHGKDFDCAGFAVGIVGREQILGPKNVQRGARVLGLPSSGFHSNGFSLVRKLFADDAVDYKDQLLAPTELYVKPVLEAHRSLKGLQALAHITGGGIHNVTRILPANLGFQLKSWEWPELFKEAQKRSKMDAQGMLKTFNCGVGMALVIDESHFQSWQDHFPEALDLGGVTESSDGEMPESRIWWPETYR